MDTGRVPVPAPRGGVELDLVKGSVRWSLPKIDNYENYDHVRGDNVSFGWDSKRNMAFISVNALVKSRSPIEHTLNLAMDQLFENGAFDHAGKLHRAMVDEAFRSLIDHGFDPSTDFYEKLELVGRYYMMIEGKPYTPETEVNYDGP